MSFTKLYVGNLNYRTTDEKLKELFSPFGDVSSVNILQGRGFGFVEMASPDAANQAKDKLNGTDFDGRTAAWQGTGDAYGTYAGPTRVTLDETGPYRYWLEGEWQGFKGFMPGLPPNGGEFYVIDKDRPAGAVDIRLNLANQSTFNPAQPLTISGTTTAATVNYALIIPGCVIEEGQLVPKAGRFEYKFDPVAINRKAPTYDIVNIVNGKTELGKVVHITFSAQEKTPAGVAFFSFTRLIFRGNRVFYAR